MAFFSAALVIASLVTYAGKISVGAYGKLLGGGKRTFLKENLSQLFYFAIPFAAISITFSKPGIFALNPIYEIAFPVVIFLSIRMMFFLLTETFHSYLIGIEDVDAKSNSTLRAYLKSKLFFLPNLQVIQNVIYITVLSIVILLETNTVSKIDLVIHWSIIALITQIPLTVYLGYLVKKSFALTLNWIRIGKYLLVSTGVFSLSYLLYDKYLVYNPDNIQFIKFFSDLFQTIKGYFLFKIFFAMGRPISPNPTNPTLIFLILTYPFHNPDSLIGRIFNWTSFNFFDFVIINYFKL